MYKHEIDENAIGVKCSCGDVASHKVEEVVDGDSRHPFTVYVCCGCFGWIMGLMAIAWCKQEANYGEVPND